MSAKYLVTCRLAGLVLASLVTGGLVLTSAGTVIGVSGPTAAMTRVFLPDLPPVSTLYPDVYDTDGCLRVPADEGGGRRCGPPLETMPPVDGSPNVYRVLQGFAGPHYATMVDGKAVTILQESLTVSSIGTWRAWGLVRNEMNRSVGNVVVTASLYAQDGTLLDQPSVTVPISVLRSGEPGPFAVRSAVAASDVVRVEWSVQAGMPNQVASRQFIIQPFWEVPFGVSEWRGVNRDDPPYPYTMATGFRNLGGRIRGATLVVAWLDENQRVVWLDTTPLDSRTTPEIPHDGSANFALLKVGDGQIGPRLYDLTKMYWVVGE